MQCAYKIVKSDRRISYNGKKEITGSYDNAILLNMKADGHNAKIVYKVSDSAKLSVDAKGVI